MTGSIKKEGVAVSWKNILDTPNASFLYQNNYKGYTPAINLKTEDGRVGIGSYQNYLALTYFLDTNTTNTADSAFYLKNNNTATLGGNALATIVASGKNTSSWYRVFSDGWIEQGGIFAGGSANNTKTVTFPRAFTTANCIMTTIVTTRGGASHDGEIFVRSKTLTSFVAGSRLNDASYYMWYACGY